MAHVGDFPPIWDLLDFTAAETLHLLSLVEFTDLLNGCSPDALLRNAFVLLRIVATARYVHLKRGSPAIDASAQPVAHLPDQLISKIYAYMKLYVFLYGKTIDVILMAERQNYMRIKKRTVSSS